MPNFETLSKITLPAEPGLERRMAQLMEEERQPYQMPTFHNLTEKVRKQVQTQLSSKGKPEGLALIRLPELRSLIGSRYFIQNYKRFAQRVLREPEKFRDVRFAFWKNSDEQDEVYRSLVVAFKLGKISLKEAQVIIAPGDFEFFVQEVVEVTREFSLVGIRMHPRERGGYKAVPLKAARLLQYERISQEDFLDFLGYRPQEKSFDPHQYRTDESVIRDVLTEYDRIHHLVPSIVSFKKGHVSLEFVQKRLNHPDFAFFLREVALYTDVFTDLFEGVSLPLTDSSGDLHSLVSQAVETYFAGNATYRQLLLFVGCSQEEINDIIEDVQGRQQSVVLARFFRGEMALSEILAAFKCSNMFATFVKKAAQLRLRFPELLPAGLMDSNPTKNGSLSVWQRVVELRKGGLITDDEASLFLGDLEGTGLVRVLNILEKHQNALQLVTRFYSGSVTLDQLERAFNCDGIADVSNTLVLLRPFAIPDAAPPPLRLNGGVTYNQSCFRILQAVERNEISAQEAQDVLAEDSKSFQSDLEKYEDLKDACSALQEMRDGKCSLVELQEYLETPSVKDLIAFGAQLSVLFAKELKVHPYQGLEITDMVYGEFKEVAELVALEQVSPDDVGLFLGWDEVQGRAFAQEARKYQDYLKILQFSDQPDSIEELAKNLRREFPASAVQYSAELRKQYPDRFAGVTIPTRTHDGQYTPLAIDCMRLLVKREIDLDDLKSFFSLSDEETAAIHSDALGIHHLNCLSQLKKGKVDLQQVQTALDCPTITDLAARCSQLDERFPGALTSEHAPLADSKHRPTPLAQGILNALRSGALSPEQALLILGGTPIRLKNLEQKHEDYRRATALVSWRKGLVKMESVAGFLEVDNMSDFIESAYALMARYPDMFKMLPSLAPQNDEEWPEMIIQGGVAACKREVSLQHFRSVFGLNSEDVRDVFVISKEWIAQEPEPTPVTAALSPLQALSKWKVGEFGREELYAVFSVQTDRDLILQMICLLVEYPQVGVGTLLTCPSSPAPNDLECSIAHLYSGEVITAGQAQALFGVESFHEFLLAISPYLALQPSALGNPLRTGESRKPKTRTKQPTKRPCKKPRLQKPKKPRQQKRQSFGREDVTEEMIIACRQWITGGIDQAVFIEGLQACSIHVGKKRMGKIKKLFPERFADIPSSRRGHRLTRESVSEDMIDTTLAWCNAEINKEEMLTQLGVVKIDTAYRKMGIIMGLFPERFEGCALPARKRRSTQELPDAWTDIALLYRKGERDLSQAMREMGLESLTEASAVILKIVKKHPELFADYPASSGRRKSRTTYSVEEQDQARKWRLGSLSTAEALAFFGSKNELGLQKLVARIANCHPSAFVGVPLRLRPEKQLSKDDIACIKRYKAGEISVRDAMQYFGVDTRGKLDWLIKKARDANPELFVGVREKAPRPDMLLSEQDVQAALDYRWGVLSKEQACEQLGVADVSLSSKVAAVSRRFPDQFKGVPTSRPEPRTMKNIRAVIGWQSGRVSFAEVCQLLGVKTRVSFERKATQVQQLFPLYFQPSSPFFQQQSQETEIIGAEGLSAQQVAQFQEGRLMLDDLKSLLNTTSDALALRAVVDATIAHDACSTASSLRDTLTPEQYTDLSLRAAVAYKKKLFSSEDFRVLFGYASLQNVRSRVLSLKRKYPSYFADVVTVQHLDRNALIEQEISIALQYKTGEISADEARQAFEALRPDGSTMSHKAFVQKVVTVVKRSPERFEGIRKTAPYRKRATGPSEEDFQMVTSYKKGEITVRALAEHFGYLHEGRDPESADRQAISKASVIYRDHPDRFVGVPHLRPTILDKQPVFSDEDVKMAIAYRYDEISPQEAMEYFGLTIVSSVSSKVLSISKQRPEAFASVPPIRLEAVSQIKLLAAHAAQKKSDHELLKGFGCRDLSAVLARKERLIPVAVRLFKSKGLDKNVLRDFLGCDNLDLIHCVVGVISEHPELGSTLPLHERPNRNKKPILTLRAVQYYLDDQMSLADALSFFGCMNAEVLRNKMNALLQHYGSHFKKGNSLLQSKRYVSRAMQYKRGELTAGQIAEAFGLQTAHAARKLVSSVKKANPDLFVDVPDLPQTKTMEASEADISIALKWRKGQLSEAELLRHFEVITRRGAEMRVAKICEAHPERFQNMPARKQLELAAAQQEHIDAINAFLVQSITRQQLAKALSVRPNNVTRKMRTIQERYPEHFKTSVSQE